jgi:hypothetical protein
MLSVWRSGNHKFNAHSDQEGLSQRAQPEPGQGGDDVHRWLGAEQHQGLIAHSWDGWGPAEGPESCLSGTRSRGSG